jgi:hypothetical protein
MQSEDLATKYKGLTERRDKLTANKLKLEAELNARKRALKEAIDQCRADGFNPDTLADDIEKLKEVIRVKMDIFEADLKTAEEQISPILKEIQ